VLHEFAPLGLERAEPRRISSPGADALSPAISGAFVMWSSQRSADPEHPAEDLDLFASDWWLRRERALVTAPGDQSLAAISGDHVAWLDGRDGAAGRALFRCRHRALGRCDAVRVTQPSVLLSRPSVSGERIAWSEDLGAGLVLQFCEVEPGSGLCPARGLAEPPSAALRRDPALDGARLVWRDFQGGTGRIRTCLLDFASGGCAPLEVDARPGPQDAGAVSGSLLAWQDVSGFSARVRVCELDEATGRCPPRTADEQGLDPRPQVSGDRVVWHSSRADDDPDVFTCEYDRVLRRCPAQAITGSAAPQRNPAIDGPRVVWEDLRSGVWEIWGIALPTMAPLDDRVATVGRPLHVLVTARDPEGAALEWRVTLADGSPVEALGAQFRELARGRGLLSWRPAADQLGSHVLTFSARARSGLETSESMRIEVREAPGRAGAASQTP
jgi:beta propeller repeat protein